MAVATISKMRLVCFNEEKDNILNSLQKTGMVQIKKSSLGDLQLNTPVGNVDKFVDKKTKIELALSIIEKELCQNGSKEENENFIQDGFDVSSEELYGIITRESALTKECDQIIETNNFIIHQKGKINEYSNEILKYRPYLCVNEKFSSFSNTKLTTIYLGTIPQVNYDNLQGQISKLDYVELYKLGETEGLIVVSLICYKNSSEALEILNDNGFVINTNRDDYCCKDIINSLESSRSICEKNVSDYVTKIKSKAILSRELKILIDYYKYEIEKQNFCGDFLQTKRAVIIEAFVPEKYQDKIVKALDRTTDKYEVEFVDVEEGEQVPTFMDNGKIAQNFEFITNMYSVPKYGSFDPNGIMGFFFSLFLGIIEADFVYGLLLAIGGYLFAKKKKGGISRLAKIIALGGLFALPFGILFDSFCGFSLIHKICELTMGKGNAYELFYIAHLDGIKSFSKVAGIDIPSLLLWSMLFGIIHITVGYILKGVQEFRIGNTIDGLISGIAWAVFMVGLGVLGIALLETVTGNIKNILQTIALAMIAVSLLFAIVFAGRHEKGLGKLKSSFGAAYGIINILSDVLSYARIYGLMLSGAQIGAIFTNTIAIDLLFSKGIVGVIFGIVIIIAGNIFNLAMGVLGAYIHDSRLQYVEFFGKFYEGEGELFTPLGSSFDHIVCVPDKIN